MATLFDYLEWRGDLTFSQAPINEVDSLIFSLLSYLDFEGIVSPEHNGTVVPLNAAANAFFARNPDYRKFTLGVLVPKEIAKLLRAVKDTKRFRDVGLTAYVNDVNNERQIQFSAVTYLIRNGKAKVVTFRGTDDSIIGWKENFNMSYLPVVPAQESAAAYLNAAATDFDRTIYVTGHSKGGNLALYAATYCEQKAQAQLEKVWGHDGPGFHQDILKDPAYLRIRPLVHCFVPQASVVGMLLHHEDIYTVVKSRQAGIFQHNGLTWEVKGNAFVRAEKISEDSLRNEQNVNKWISEMTDEQRAGFVDAIERVLRVRNADTLAEALSSVPAILSHAKQLDPKIYSTIQQMISALLTIQAQNLFKKR